MKLIKLNEKDYIIVDGSEIEEGDFMYDIDGDIGIAIGKDKSQWEGNRKIIHSTRLLKSIKDYDTDRGILRETKRIPLLSLSEIEELLFGYSVEKLSEKKCKTNLGYLIDNTKKWFWKKGFKAGFNAHKELVKDKLFTIEDILIVIEMARLISNGKETFDCESIAGLTETDTYGWKNKYSTKQILQSLQPTEWNVEFINGKLTLKD